jgi:signal peptidase I
MSNKRSSRSAAKSSRSDSAKGKSQPVANGGATSKSKSQAAKSDPVPSGGALRETIESIVIAFVLAFLFRTFEAEAFVIPTGSMAPTLMGRHKDLVCPQCGYPFQVSASDEVDDRGHERPGNDMKVEAGICPMCRYAVDMTEDNWQGEEYPSFKGDRILVSKFVYDYSEPDRWDVAVFKFPGGAQTNFIKRIVGLPEETVRIENGDIFVRRYGAKQFRIARKSPRKLLAMMQPVYDNDYVLPRIIELGWPPRWQPDRADPGPAGWQNAPNSYKSFTVDGTSDELQWLRYQHYVPSWNDWQHFLGIRKRVDPPRPRLIADFCAYNTNRLHGQRMRSPEPPAHNLGEYWVGDLIFECEMAIESDQGQAVLELIEGGVAFRCRFDVATGEATLSIEGHPEFEVTAETPLRGPGDYTVRFANADDQLVVWVDDEVIEFDGPTTFEPLNNDRPTPNDLSPVGIGSDGVAMRVTHLKISRDLYYIAARAARPSDSRYGERAPISEYGHRHSPDLLWDPSTWRAFDSRQAAEFNLGPDHFLVLGDNSARSRDSRLWDSDGFEYYVRRELLIGKALYIYWPHSWNEIPGTGIPFPFFPNFSRMGLVR